MKLLLDTHAFVWWATEPAKLSVAAAHAIADPGNDLWLSVASAWEMQIKLQAGKLKLFLPLDKLITLQQTVNRLQVLSVELLHVLALDALPLYHRDPFDRILAAQATVEKASLISCDPQIARYGVSIVW